MFKYKEKRILIFLAVFLVFLFPIAQAVTNPYEDVTANHWSYDPANKQASNKVTEDKHDPGFSPDSGTTRNEMVITLQKLNEIENSIKKIRDSQDKTRTQLNMGKDTILLKEQVKQATLDKLNQNVGYRFSSVTSLGKPEVFINTIDSLNIVQSSKGNINYKDGVLTIPSNFNPKDPVQQTTIYQAVVHTIEDKKDPSGFNNPLYLSGVDRYDTNIKKLDEVSGALKDFEKSIEKGDLQDRSYNQWKIVEGKWKSYFQYNIDSGDQTDSNKRGLNIGTQYNIDDIISLYQSGAAGEKYKIFFNNYPPTPTPKLLTIDWSDMPKPCIGGDNCYSNREDSITGSQPINRDDPPPHG
ncbi:hypothetical protein [Methanospirillum lacunae]|uniref:SLH domain-containing protein n=1 Tax=Methanospirillum lacunae TaxID=668570 RepID=A0A2V2MV42_9EURY|nr:hypothetical protein [Methanospirillum lacunae]PWR70160.1 hypothetical protein DK846_15600 [Methanospirillum lacunae]